MSECLPVSCPSFWDKDFFWVCNSPVQLDKLAIIPDQLVSFSPVLGWWTSSSHHDWLSVWWWGFRLRSWGLHGKHSTSNSSPPSKFKIFARVNTHPHAPFVPTTPSHSLFWNKNLKTNSYPCNMVISGNKIIFTSSITWVYSPELFIQFPN